ncbi:hypothetical protein [Chryseobacterium paludis]|uniref:hypothetical protein n=1 Tax=Chryseobacterium paludis TaxID=2956784 RepID=UPI0021BEB53A|nr:hypothetical protein [Chryseobacterium paludis]
MKILSIQQRNSHKFFMILFVLISIQSCYAQNKEINNFFSDAKKSSYQYCVKESGINSIKKTNENKDFLRLMIKGCEDRGLFFDNLTNSSVTLLSSLQGKQDDFIIFNWKVYSPYIPAPSVTILQSNKTEAIEFTYYDEEKNAYDIPLKRKAYEEKEGKFKNELLFAQSKLNGDRADNGLSRYEQNDYYIIKRSKGKYTFYTIVDGELKEVK